MYKQVDSRWSKNTKDAKTKKKVYDFCSNPKLNNELKEDLAILEKVPIILYSISGPQLNTLHNLAKFLLRSLVVSVLPVPAGPAGAPPKFNLSAPIKVM